jgi:hypothetical protein
MKGQEPEETQILVCQAGSCRMRGSEAVLLEIEELARFVDENCDVQGSGCLGLCSQAPGVVVLKKLRGKRQAGKEIIHTRIDSMEASAKVVLDATGKMPPLDDPKILQRLSGVRAMRVREYAIAHYRWNQALRAVSDQLAAQRAKGARPGELQELAFASKELFSKAGFPAGPPFEKMPAVIAEYSQWSLDGLTMLSRHTAVFHFSSKDRKRGTPNPRGGGRAPPEPKTWHTTLLALVGANDEGPLPWVERDYTPISGSLDWERGKCDILIKIYTDGAATSWLHRALIQSQTCGEVLRVWLSKPVQTLSVPYLITGTAAFNPASVLLLLAGTGVVALPQILHHRDPYKKIGISTRKTAQLHVPVDLMLSCRADDVLMVPEIMQLCREACDFAASSPGAEVTVGVRRCTLLLSKPDPTVTKPPFPDVGAREAQELGDVFKSLPNVQVIETRLTFELVQEAIARMPAPCRVVISGPSGYNAAARSMLVACNVCDDAITVLEA